MAAIHPHAYEVPSYGAFAHAILSAWKAHRPLSLGEALLSLRSPNKLSLAILNTDYKLLWFRIPLIPSPPWSYLLTFCLYDLCPVSFLEYPQCLNKMHAQ